jgi:hypothetical protein
LIHYFTPQDIPKAWQSALDFAKLHVVPPLMADYYGKTVLGKNDPTVQTEFQRTLIRAVSQDPDNWYAKAMFWGVPRSTWINSPVTSAQAVVDYGRPVTQLTEAGSIMYDLYSTMMKATSVMPEKWHLYASPKRAGSFLFHEGIADRPPFQLDLQKWESELIRSSDDVLRELVRQSTPALQFLYKEDSIQSQTPVHAGNSTRLRLMSAATVLNIDPNEAQRLYDNLSRLGSSPWQSTAIAMHEFGHASFQIQPFIGTNLMRDYVSGKTPLSEVLSRYVMGHEFMNEAMSDIFSMAMSLNPSFLMGFRYVGGAVSELIHSAHRGLQTYQGWKFGDPIRARVIDPRTIEDPNSPLMRLIRRHAEAFEQAILRGVSNTGDAIADAAANVLDPAYRGRVRATSDPYNTVYFAVGSLSDKMVEGLKGLMVDKNIDPQSDLQLDEDAQFVLRHQGSRFWTIGYLVGKARPDLIGEELLVTPHSVRTASGEEIDIAGILPDIKPYNLGGGEVHPVLLERAFKAVELYERARSALQRGVRVRMFGRPEEAIQEWMTVFSHEVLKDPNPVLDTEPLDRAPQVIEPAMQAQIVHQTLGTQVITGQGGSVHQARKNQNLQP